MLGKDAPMLEALILTINCGDWSEMVRIGTDIRFLSSVKALLDSCYQLNQVLGKFMAVRGSAMEF